MSESRPSDQPLSPAGIVVVVAAAVSVFAAAAELTTEIVNVLDPSVTTAAARAAYLLPHTLIAAIALAGFRRGAALAAFAVGPVMLKYGGFMALMTLSPALMWLAVLQVVMLTAALVELRPWRTTFYTAHPERRAIGAMIPLALWGMITGLLASAHASEAQRRAAAADSTASVEERAAVRERAAWMERSNLNDLMTLARCVELFRGADGAGRAPRSIAEMQRWAARATDRSCHDVFASADSADRPFAGVTDHSRVRYVPPPRLTDPWHASAFSLALDAVWTDADAPVRTGAPGTRSYLIDSAGAVHVTAQHRRATVADTTLPACGRSESPANGAACLPFVPRQRWGVTPVLPLGAISLGEDSVRVGDTASFALTFRTGAPIDSIGTISVDWDERAARTTVAVAANKSFTRSPSGLTFTLPHIFADSGRHIVRATVATRDGSRYRYLDTLRAYRMIRLSGQIGLDARGRLVRGGVDAEARQALENIRDALVRQGSSLARVGRCDVVMTDIGEWSRVVRVLESVFPGGRVPPYSVMPNPDLRQRARVQFDCVAAPG